ncbi:hypothetical protein [Neorhizobium galegae]|uniref:hypothetical protein n=1 Tax=Neorhizobium galegae TaxID=399 RepID=UPI001783EA65|nr:hypothetical protein [Neorhizobium galegae]
MPTLNTTPNRAYQEPFVGNSLEIDVGRIIAALRAIDTDVSDAFAQIVAKAGLVSPAFTGTPTAPTAAPGDDSNKIANTAFVRAALAALVGLAPEALDTLEELAAASEDNSDLIDLLEAALAAKADTTAMTAALAGKAAHLSSGTSDDTFDDTDELAYVTGTTQKRGTLTGLISSIFKTARTIANARFEGSTFGLILSAFRLTIAGVLTAARTITVPDRDITLGMVRLSQGVIPGNVAVDWAVVAGPRRYVLGLSAFSTNGTGVPMLQLKAGGVAETSGYSGGAANSGTSTGLANSSGFYFNSGNSAALTYDLQIELINLRDNIWICKVFGSNAGPGTVGSGGSKTLAGPIDGLRLTTPGAVNVPDNGEYTLYAEY